MSSSSLFLSGEADPTLQSQREERLSSMLSESTSRLNKKDDTIGDGKEEKEKGKKKFRPLRMIQVIDEKTPDQHDIINDNDHDDDDDDDDESDGPPPLCSVESSSDISTPKHISNTDEDESNSNKGMKGNAAESRRQQQQLDHDVGDDDDQGPSLMEQMMADASKARAEKEKVRKARERKDAKSSSLSFGLKKGFLNSNSKSSNNNGAKNRSSSSNNNNKTRKERTSPSSSSNSSGFRKGFLDSGTKTKLTSSKSDRGNKDNKSRRGGKPSITEEDVYELDSEGNILPSTTTKSKPPTKQKPQETKSPTVRPKSSKTATIDLKPSATTNINNNKNPLCFQEVQEAMNKNDPLYKLSKGEWATPDLMEKISQNPRLMAGMANPKFAAALEALAQDPKNAMSKFEHHPDVADFLREFCGVLGEHFVQLGEKEKGVDVDEQKQKKQQESMGPMAEAALKREQERIARGKESWDRNLKQEEKRKLDDIMSNEKLTALLMDPEMQRVMQECSVPGRMQMYAAHPEYGPKLRLMMEAGLLRFA